MSLTLPHELNPTDRAILELLESEGDRTPVWIADDLGKTRQYVHNRLQLLVAADLVENVGHGIYSLAREDWREYEGA